MSNGENEDQVLKELREIKGYLHGMTKILQAIQAAITEQTNLLKQQRPRV